MKSIQDESSDEKAMQNRKENILKLPEYGFKLFPCHGYVDGKCTCGKTACQKSSGKHPLVVDSLMAATLDISTLEEWIKQSPRANWAVSAQQSGLLVIDVDPRSGGHLSLEKLKLDLSSDFPETVCTLTGNYSTKEGYVRGEHHYFRYSGTLKFPANLNSLGYKGIDIKNNGYTIVPPSSHPSGLGYDWALGRAPWEIDIAELSGDLLELLASVKGASKSKVFSRKTAKLTDLEWAETWKHLASRGGKSTTYAQKMLEELCKSISKLKHGDGRNTQLNNAAMRMGHLIGGEQISLIHCQTSLFDAGRTSYEDSTRDVDIENVLRTDGGGFEAGAKEPQFPLVKTLEQTVELLKLRVFNMDPAKAHELETLMNDGFFGNGGIQVASLRLAIKCISPIAADLDKNLLTYKEGVWRKDGVSEITNRVATLLGERQRKEHAGQVVHFESHESPRIAGVGPKEFINCKNGMLNWKTGELLKHDPTYYSTYQITQQWNEEATCETVDWWLSQVLEAELIELAWEVIGIALYAGVGFQKAILLLGPGRNGKGTFLRLIEKLIPAHVLSHVDLHSFGSDKFATSSLFGKIANLSGDLRAEALPSTSEFKKLTGDDIITAQFKHKQSFDFLNHATLIFSMNELPGTGDTSFGFYERIHILPFTGKTLKADEIDPTWEPRMHLELEGVLLKAVLGLRRAMNRGRLDSPPMVEEALARYRLDSNPVEDFINEKTWITENAEDFVSRKEMFFSYQYFCQDLGYPSLSNSAFKNKLIAYGSGKIKERKKGSDRGYVGVVLIKDPSVFCWPNGAPI